MSGYLGKTMRQPGGIRVKCEFGYTGGCDCGVFNNYGAPAQLRVQFGAQWSMATIGWCSSDCGVLNDNDPSLPSPCPQGGAGGGPFFLTPTAFAPILIGNAPTYLAMPQSVCYYGLNGIGIPDPCGPGEEVSLQAAVGYDPRVGVFAALAIVSPISGFIYYSWGWTNLPIPPGLVGCRNETQVPPSFYLDDALGAAALAGNSFYYEWDNLITPCTPNPTGQRFLCFGCNSPQPPGPCGKAPGTYASQGTITGGFACDGGTRTAPPCCCGEPTGNGSNSRQNPGCMFLCFSCNGTNSISCQLCGVAMQLCPNGDNQWTGTGVSTDGLPINVTVTNSNGGNWGMKYTCGGGSPISVSLTGNTAGGAIQLTGNTNGAKVSITNGLPGPCPGGNITTCLEGVYVPASVLVTIPSVGCNGCANCNQGPCGLIQDNAPTICCPTLGGTYALDIGGGPVCGLFPDACGAFGCCGTPGCGGAAGNYAFGPLATCSVKCCDLLNPRLVTNAGGIAALNCQLCCDGSIDVRLCTYQNWSSCCSIGGARWGCLKPPLAQFAPGATFTVPWMANTNNACAFQGTTALVEFL